jgi:hypothetical protein
MKCGRKISPEEVEASRKQYGDKAELCSQCVQNLAAAIRRGRAAQSFHRACYGYACEWPGTKTDVSIGGQAIASATSVTIRHAPCDDEVQGEPARYELTLFDQGGHWRQLVFSPGGDVLDELIGYSHSPPKISRHYEAL